MSQKYYRKLGLQSMPDQARPVQRKTYHNVPNATYFTGGYDSFIAHLGGVAHCGCHIFSPAAAAACLAACLD